MASKRKGKRRSGVKILIVVILTAIIMVAGIGVFFNVRDITVRGAGENYTEEQILEISGLKTGKSLLFYDLSGAESKIMDACPYISSVTVKRVFPSTIVIELHESSVCAAVEYGGVLWLIDQNCRVLGEAESPEQCMVVTGLSITKAVVGSTIEIEEEDTTKLDYTKTILAGLGSDEFSSQVTQLDMSNIGNITFNVGEDYTVKLGSGEKLDYKLSRVESVINQLEDGEKAIIDVSKDGETFVTPKS